MMSILLVRGLERPCCICTEVAIGGSQGKSQDNSKHYSSAESAHHPWKMQYIRGIYNMRYSRR